MHNSTIKQHYVWRYYLSPWTSNEETDGHICCLMDNKIFSTALVGIGNQRYFYKVPNFTERQIQLAKLCNESLSNDSNLKKANEKWIEVFQLPLAVIKQSSIFIPTNEVNEFYEYMRNNTGESYHSMIEQFAIKQLVLLKSHDCSFLNNDEGKGSFYFYLANQFTRTKRMRDKVLESIANDRNKPEGYSLDSEDEKILDFFAKIFVSTNLSFALTNKGFRITFLDNNSELPFVTGDQPVINTYADYSNNTMPEKLAFYYPLTPKLAILVHNESQSALNRDALTLSSEQVDLYNKMIVTASLQQIYANDQTTLERYRKREQVNPQVL